MMFSRRSQPREQELDAELKDHLERQTEDYIATGMTPEEAGRRARLIFGGTTQIKEQCRDVHLWAPLDSLLQDVKLALRGVRKSPAFASLVIATMAIGIGANTTMFSVVRAVFLKPLPFPDADRLVTLWESDPARGTAQRRVTGPNFVDWEAQSSAFDAMGVVPNWTGASATFNVVGTETVERVPGVYASSGLFRVLGVPPRLGRTFGADDDRRRGERHVIISHAYWKERFAGDAAVLGRTIDVDTFGGGKFTIIGVMPAGFDFPRGTKIWLSLGEWGGGPLPSRDSADRGAPWYLAFARLKSGVTADGAESELSAIAGRISQQHPEASRVAQVKIVPLRESLVGEHRLALWMLVGAVGCVLLIGCANVANLVLSRGVGRRKELLTRMALGATRWRISRQLIVENVVLCGAGTLLGLGFAAWAQGVLARVIAGYVPLAEDTAMDVNVLVFAALLTIASGLFCGLMPLVDWRKLDWRSRGQTEGSASKRLRQGLVVSEVALAVILMAMAGLLIRTLAKLQSVDIGFETNRLLSVSIDVTTEPLRGRGNAARFLEALIPRIGALPGVSSVGASTARPLEEEAAAQPITREDRRALTAAESPRVLQTAVTPDYFRALGVELRSGRMFTEADTAEGKLVAMLNETAARRYWPGEDPVGKRFAIGSRERFGRFRPPGETGAIEWREIVGVVRDMRSAGFASEVQPEVYYCYKQSPVYSPMLVARTDGEPAMLAAAIRREISAVSSRAVVTAIRTMEEVAAESLAGQRLRAVLVGSFSALALLLGMLGIYGVLSYTVGRRTQEIGIRMALGAQRRQVSRMVFKQVLALTAVGIVLGIAGAFAVARWIATLLFGVQPLDIPSFAGACLLLLVMSMLASYAPARKAMRVDPVIALRNE